MDGKILTAIVDIRSQKKRPSRDAIFDIITKTNSCTLEEFNEAFDAMESNGLIENRGTAKNESYFGMAHFFGALKQSILAELATERQNNGNDVTDFKQYIHTEFVALKAEVGDIGKKTRICFDENPSKAGASLRDELINNSFPPPSQQKPSPSPSHSDAERVILQQQREIDFLRNEILSLNEIIKISLRNQTQNQAANQLECDVIKNSKKPNNAQWQEIPSRGPRVQAQQKAPLSSYENPLVIEDSNNGAAQKQSSTKEDKKVKSRKQLVTSNQVSSDQPKQKTSCENRFAVLSIDDDESDPEVLNDQKEKKNPRGGQKKNNVNLNEKQSTERKSARKQKSTGDTTTNSLDNRAKVKVTMIGDSQLKRLQPEKLCNNHHTVDIRAFGGMKIQQAAKKLGKCDSNIIIVHAGTNNVQDSSPETLVHETMTTLNKIQKQNPSAQVVYSSVFRRKEHNEKVQKFNRLIEEEVSLNGIELIDNSNIYFRIFGRMGYI